MAACARCGGLKLSEQQCRACGSWANRGDPPSRKNPTAKAETKEAEALRERVAELEASLRPFADAYRAAPGREREYGRGWALWDALTEQLEIEHFARAAELVPERKE